MTVWSNEVYTSTQQATVDDLVGAISVRTTEELFTIVRSVIALHSPLNPPTGKTWYGGGTDAYCTVCDTVWPCGTLQVIVKLMALV